MQVNIKSLGKCRKFGMMRELIKSWNFSVKFGPTCRTMGKWHCCQHTKERWPRQLQQLMRYYTPSNDRQSLLQYLLSRLKETAKAKGRASWILIQKIMCRPDFHPKLIDESIKWQKLLIIHYIDFKKAFNSFHCNSLWNTLSGIRTCSRANLQAASSIQVQYRLPDWPHCLIGFRGQQACSAAQCSYSPMYLLLCYLVPVSPALPLSCPCP